MICVCMCGHKRVGLHPNQNEERNGRFRCIHIHCHLPFNVFIFIYALRLYDILWFGRRWSERRKRTPKNPWLRAQCAQRVSDLARSNDDNPRPVRTINGFMSLWDSSSVFVSASSFVWRLFWCTHNETDYVRAVRQCRFDLDERVRKAHSRIVCKASSSQWL